jgi:hypothetical protein
MADDDAHDDVGIDNGFVQGDDEALKAAIKAREAQCTPQLLRESPAQALKIALQDPPYNTRTMAVKEQSAMVVVKALLAIKEADSSQARTAPPRLLPHRASLLSRLAPPRTRCAARAGLAPASPSSRAPNPSPLTPGPFSPHPLAPLCPHPMSPLPTPPRPTQALAGLSAEELDVLMKYVYRGLAMPKRDQDHYKSLLKWHPKVLASAGPASIVRVMAEVSRPL